MSEGTLYDEAYAKLVLEYFFPESCKNLVMKDKPDLQNATTGIEVTTAISNKSMELDSLYSKLSSGKIKNEVAVVKRIEGNGGQLKNGILSHPVMNDDFKNILFAHKNKIDKLNSGNYKTFENNFLFIIDHILTDEKMLKQALNDFDKQQQNYKSKFDLIIVCVPSYLYVFDMLQSNIRCIDYPNDIQFKLANNAIKIARKQQ